MKYKPLEKKEYYTLERYYKEGAEFDLRYKDIDSAINYMQKYVETIEKKRIVLKKRNCDEYLLLKYNTRFSKKYKKKIKKKLQCMLNVRTTCGHLVLTIENLDFEDLITKKQKISETLHLFFKELQRKYKTKIMRIVTREVTYTKDKKFHLHFHCLLIGWAYISKEKLDFIKKTWTEIAKKQQIRAEYSHYVYLKNKNILLSYILKYITKDFITVNLTSTCLTVLNLKSYTTTLKDNTNLNEKIKEFEFYGIIDEKEVQDFVQTHVVLNTLRNFEEKDILEKKIDKDPPKIL